MTQTIPTSNAIGTSDSRTGESPARYLPGEVGLWILVFADIFIFTLLFGTFLGERHHDPDLFASSQAKLGLTAAAANTAVLLTSSLLVVEFVQRYRRSDPMAARFAVAAILGGFAFLAIKGLEWAHLVAGGVTPLTNGFFTWYFVLTGLHFTHLCIGLVALVFARRAVARHVPRPHDRQLVEGAATYWHMVDLLWLLIFAVVHLGVSA